MSFAFIKINQKRLLKGNLPSKVHQTSHLDLVLLELPELALESEGQMMSIIYRTQVVLRRTAKKKKKMKKAR